MPQPGSGKPNASAPQPNERPAEEPSKVHEPSPVRPPNEPTPSRTPASPQADENEPVPEPDVEGA